MTLLIPNSELVAAAWLAQVPGLTPAAVGTTLPRMPASGNLPAWAGTGFVQIIGVGGTPDAYSIQGRPVMGVNCWACTASQAVPAGPITVSNKPPWGRAAQLAESIRQAVQSLMFTAAGRRVAMSVPGYGHALIQGAYMVTEPRRIPSDVAGFARFQFDLQLHWIAEAT